MLFLLFTLLAIAVQARGGKRFDPANNDQFVQTMYFQPASQARAVYTTEEVLDFTYLPPSYVNLLQAFPIDVTVSVMGNTVEIFIPGFSCFIPYNFFPDVDPTNEEGNPVVDQANNSYGRGGYLLTVKGSLPKDLWHSNPTPYAFNVQSANSPLQVVLYVTNSGDFVFGSTDFSPLYNPANVGAQGANYSCAKVPDASLANCTYYAVQNQYFSFFATTISYTLPLETFHKPKEWLMQAGVSNFTGTVNGGLGGQPNVFSGDFFKGHRAAIWVSSIGSSDPSILLLYVSVSKVDAAGHTTSVGTPFQLISYIPQVFIDLSCFNATNATSTIVSVGAVYANVRINPTHVKNLVSVFVLSQTGSFIYNGSTGAKALVASNLAVAYTLDGGVSWNTTYYNLSQMGLALDQKYDDPNIVPTVFDKFGNFWLLRSILDPDNGFFAYALFLSTDKGRNFVYVETLSYGADGYGITDCDMAVGYGGASGPSGPYALYMACTIQQQAAPFQRDVFLAYKTLTASSYSPTTISILTSVQLQPSSINSLISEPQLIVGEYGVVSIIARETGTSAQYLQVQGGCEVATADITPGYVTGTGNYGRVVLYNMQNLSYFPLVNGPLDVFTANIGWNNMVGYLQNVVNPGKPINFLSIPPGDYGVPVFASAFPEGVHDIAYDPVCKLLWVTYCDAKPPQYEGNIVAPVANVSMGIYVINSRNFGKSWSNQRLVSSTKNQRIWPSISVDGVHGLVSVCWQDGRLDVNFTGGATQPYCVTFKSTLD